MEYKDLTLEAIMDAFTELNSKNTEDDRSMILYTGTGGKDLYDETMENHWDFTRVYLGKKVLRILRMSKSVIKQSANGRYYKLVKLKI